MNKTGFIPISLVRPRRDLTLPRIREQIDMQRLQEEIEDFTTFAREKLLEGANISLDELYDQWREAHPAAEDALAVQASLRDMEQGETGRHFSEFATEFTTRNKISDEQ